MVLLAMTTLQLIRVQPNFLGDSVGDPNLHDIYLELPDSCLDEYSNELLDLISECIQVNLADRPTFAEIVQRIGVAIDENGSNLANGKRYTPSGQVAANDNDRVREIADRIQRGLMRPDLVPP